MSEPIRQSITLPVPPQMLYSALMSSKHHGAFTNGKAQIPDEVGAAFSAHDGQITGRNLDLVPGQRIVQAWRAEAWPAGVFSVVRFDLEASGEGTKLTLTHTGVPADAHPHIEVGWGRMYWEPMKVYFSAPG